MIPARLLPMLFWDVDQTAYAADTSVWMTCATDLRTLIIASDADFTSSNTLIRKLAWDRSTLSTGGVILSSGQQVRKPATNKSEDVEYAVLVTALVGSNQAHDDQTELESLLDWRETIRNAVIGQVLTSAYDTMVIPGTVVVPDAFDRMFDATQLTVRCKVRD